MSDMNSNAGEKHQEQQYLDLLRRIIDTGVERMDRTGTGTKSIFGTQMRFDLSKSFPLFTTKRVWFKGIVHELIWLLSGNTNIKYLKENDVGIWDEWADENGDLGPVYGQQWRSWSAPKSVERFEYNEDGDETCWEEFVVSSVDQIARVINSIKTKPYDRGHIVSAWNVADLDKMALRPCHTMFQFYVAEGKLSCQLYQRSCDLGLGGSFNVASYSLLSLMIAQVCDMKPAEFVWTIGDAHVYNNHVAAIEEQLKREPYKLPRVELDASVKLIDDFRFEHVKLVDYKCHPGIKMEVAV